MDNALVQPMNEQFKKPLPGTDLYYFDTREAVESIEAGAYDKLPFCSKVLCENLVRRCPPEELTDALKQHIEGKQDLDFPWYPARVVCHDILGQTAFVDLAGLRDAIAEQGGDPSKVNPIVPTQLIVDHSLAVEHAGFEENAFEKNRAIEERRNDDRFHFINWCQYAFDNVNVVPPGNGIMHQINLEKMSPVVQVVHNKAGEEVAFADTLVGTDSHTPMVDALGVISIGVGGLEAESVMLGNPSYMRLPDYVGVKLTGKLQKGITGTDLVLAMTEFLRDAGVVSTYIEFFGDGARQLSVGDRASISNMTPEYGATAAMFYIDEQTTDYLRLTGRSEEQIKLVEQYAKQTGLWADGMEKAEYARVLEFDLSSVVRNMAGPSRPHARVSTTDLVAKGIAHGADEKLPEPKDGLMPDAAVIIAAITSCTNTSNPRNMVAAGLVARNANAKGLLRKPWVKSSLAPGSKTVKMYLEEAGMPELQEIGFDVVGFACTTCNGMSGALDPDIEKEIIDNDLFTTAVLSGNRNFDGRIHPYAKQAFLASPPLVIAYAIAGNIRFDIEKDSLGKDQQGNDIYLKDIWFDDDEVDAIVAAAVKPEQFNAVYIPMFDEAKKDTGKALSHCMTGVKPLISAVRRIGKKMAKKNKLTGLRPLAVLGDNITTDHMSPSNAILGSSAAGEYLDTMGLPAEDYNSYATHRGDHLTAQRATFANPKLLNEMVRDEDGEVVQGSLARVEPEGQVMRMWEAIETYMNREQPLIIIAGDGYGQGSSRDWAAKGVRLAGVEAVVAEDFERIHRQNLVGMGALPLQFEEGTTRHTLNINGTETFDVTGEVSAGGLMTLVIHRADGSTTETLIICRLDTADEVKMYNAGGMLQRFAKEFIEGTLDIV
ncbi:LOW QUALITY PROTEIN: 2-methylcitrate dehydratase FeS dependent [Psychrobacter sp. JCM 18901]|nr:LOW QUALITY PROTEIN: 2-methylcitrate dehydratase FeS dependent [Psychrobacter sp. JCM 18901]